MRPTNQAMNDSSNEEPSGSDEGVQIPPVASAFNVASQEASAQGDQPENWRGNGAVSNHSPANEPAENQPNLEQVVESLPEVGVQIQPVVPASNVAPQAASDQGDQAGPSRENGSNLMQQQYVPPFDLGEAILFIQNHIRRPAQAGSNHSPANEQAESQPNQERVVESSPEVGVQIPPVVSASNVAREEASGQGDQAGPSRENGSNLMQQQYVPPFDLGEALQYIRDHIRNQIPAAPSHLNRRGQVVSVVRSRRSSRRYDPRGGGDNLLVNPNRPLRTFGDIPPGGDGGGDFSLAGMIFAARMLRELRHMLRLIPLGIPHFLERAHIPPPPPPAPEPPPGDGPHVHPEPEPQPGPQDGSGDGFSEQ